MRWRITTLVALAAIVLFVVGLWVTGELLDDAPAAAPNSSAPSTQPPGPRQCQPVATTDHTGQPLLPFWLDQVRAVHDAACRRDYAELARLMDEPFRNSKPAGMVDRWRTFDPEGVRLDILSGLLETKGTLSQGGLVFCQDDGLVGFARGTRDRPGKWSEFAIFIFQENTQWTRSGFACD